MVKTTVKTKTPAKKVEKTPVKSSAKNLPVMSVKGVVSSMPMPKEFSVAENLPLLAQAIRVYKSSLYIKTSKTKTRAEVKISKRKIYKQKHTGRARHGAKSAPIFVGGGTAHGPKPVKRELSLSKKMKSKALSIALSIKAKQGRILVLDGASKITKTKEAKSFLDIANKKQLGGKSANSVLYAISSENANTGKQFRNIENTSVSFYKDLNAYSVFFTGLLVIDKEAIVKNA